MHIIMYMYVKRKKNTFRNTLNQITSTCTLLKNHYLPSIVFVEYNALTVIIITDIQINIFNVKCLWL